MNTSQGPDRILKAAQQNNATEILRLVNQEGVNPSHSNGVGQSALHVAALWGNGESCRHEILIFSATS